ncbi:MAG: hypothetical protein HQK79_18135 [Desulfobacterales bacterium]|nr:hypothetical protein [Desulfobacterales bacterium]
MFFNCINNQQQNNNIKGFFKEVIDKLDDAELEYKILESDCKDDSYLIEINGNCIAIIELENKRVDLSFKANISPLDSANYTKIFMSLTDMVIIGDIFWIKQGEGMIYGEEALKHFYKTISMDVFNYNYRN